jgi:hypothetical protein
MWITNRILNPNLDLRKTDDLNVPGHKVAISATTLCTFRRIWNADDYQYIPPPHYKEQHPFAVIINIPKLSEPEFLNI